MKRMFISLMLLVIGVVNVSVVSASTNEKWKEKDDNMAEDAITESRYRYYTEEKVGEYLNNLDERRGQYQYRDNNDIKYLEYGKWLDNCDVNMEVNDIDNRTLHAYQRVMGTRFIVLNNFSGVGKITAINIYNNDKLIEYQILACSDCSKDDMNFDENKEIKLYLNEVVDVIDLKIEIKLEGIEVINYQLTTAGDMLLKNISLQKDVSSQESIFTFDKSWLDNSSYGEVFYNVDLMEIDDFTKYLGQVDKCRYREFQVYNYNLTRHYYDDNYYTDVEGYLKDENDYKIYYLNPNTPVSNASTLSKVENETLEVEEERVEIDVSKVDNEEKKKSKNKDNKISKNVDTKLVKTLSISDDKSIVKYAILIVIGLTIIYIIYANRNYLLKR